MLQLTDQIALVTGATGGIGSAIARELRRCGVTVSGSGPTEPAPSLDSEELQTFMRADLSADDSADELAREIQRRFDRLEILVHSAASLEIGSLSTSSITALDDMYRVNVRAPVKLTQALLPLLVRSQGQIVFINSSAGLAVPPNIAGYAATKHALRAIADGLRDELNASGVRVISIFCGRVATPMQERLCRHEGRPYQRETLLQPEDVAAVLSNALMMPRTAEVTNIHVRPMKKS